MAAGKTNKTRRRKREKKERSRNINFFCPRLTAFSPRRCGGFASVLPSPALFLSDARSCWFTFVYRATGLRAVGVLGSGLTRLSWVSQSLSGCHSLALCVLIIPHFWRFVKTFFEVGQLLCLAAFATSQVCRLSVIRLALEVDLFPLVLSL